MNKSIKLLIISSIITFLCACNNQSISVSTSEHLNQTAIPIEQSNMNLSSGQQQKQNVEPNSSDFFGEWIVNKQVASCKVSAATKDEINMYVGKKISYSSDYVKYEDSKLSNPNYKIMTISSDEFFNNCYTSSENVGLSEKTITEVQVFLDKDSKKAWNSLGADFYIKDSNTLILLTNKGIYYELSRAKETNKDKENNVASDSESTIASLIPKGWHVLEKSKGQSIQALGDLNKDGIDDIAIVIEGDKNNAEEAPQRALLIAFGKGNNQYSLSVIAEKAILKADEGGVWGDPLDGIMIDRGSVVISFYGGSNDRWYAKYRFRFQDNDWYLIGATLGSYYTGTMTQDNANEEDYNLLTGDFSIRKTDEHEPSNSKTTKGNRGKTGLLKLKDFVASGGKEQFLK